MHRWHHITDVAKSYAILTAFVLAGFITGTAAVYGTLQAAYALGLYAGGAA